MRSAGVVHDWLSNTIYLKKDTSVTKVDLTTWKSRPLGGNLFAADSEMTDRITTINQFEAANERRMGVDADETWYASLPKSEYLHNWMHLLATIDKLEKRGTHMVKDESGSEGTIVPLCMINLVKHDKMHSSALPIKPNLQHVKQRNLVPTSSYTTTNMGDHRVAYVESNLQWLRYVQATMAIMNSQRIGEGGWQKS